MKVNCICVPLTTHDIDQSFPLAFFTGVRNDRNKKKKVKPEVSESQTIPPEIEDIVQKVLQAHVDTFPADPIGPAFSVVRVVMFM